MAFPEIHTYGADITMVFIIYVHISVYVYIYIHKLKLMYNKSWIWEWSGYREIFEYWGVFGMFLLFPH